MTSPIIQFLRPTFYAVVAFAFFAGLMNIYWSASASSVAGIDADELAGIDLSEVVFPSPKLKPDDVVRLQLKGLGDSKRDGVGILQCFCLASPANRTETGPLKHFGEMVRNPPFDAMTSPRAALVGRPQIENNVAKLLVTIIDAQHHVRIFAFVLSRQDEAPFQGCWMTDAVLATNPPAAPPPAELPSA
ncbi:hypothetical protein [Lacipirellula parvula]|uniref:DUF4864 domain-containing protein n=1 Tax=Lacipirellula parvula TaxID=2650471 RepID=A0A5K7XNJ2_9BACT|nr:hypothetical protein [Lacipirellula parvula]BBO36423.1 hypothetical protein PLANPX_6035 [Lacipirellula parvula]